MTCNNVFQLYQLFIIMRVETALYFGAKTYLVNINDEINKTEHIRSTGNLDAERNNIFKTATVVFEVEINLFQRARTKSGFSSK